MANGSSGQSVLAFSLSDLNPLHWLGSAASAAVGDVWKAAMTALWSAGLWVLGLAFKIIDAFTTPDLSAGGPLARVLPYTFAIGAFVAVLMAFIQIGIALYQRNGQSIARVMVGTVQFGFVWVGYVAIAAILVTATAGLTQGLLEALLHVKGFSGVPATANWPTKIDDTVVATVLGLCTVFVIFPAAIGYVLLMLVREAALLILASTSPIAAGGLLSESTRAWFWKSLRWFIASLLMAPLAALVLGIGIQICEGTIEPPPKPTLPPQCHGNPLSSNACLKAAGQVANNVTTQQVGMAVTGCIIILIGAICPLLLFRLLAFVDPGTPSGAAMRASFAANGGLAGLLGGKGASGGADSETAGTGAATKQDGSGTSAGEASADSQTAGRFSSVLGGAGQVMGAGMQAVGKVTSRAAAIGSDVLGSAGVGHQATYFGQDRLDSGNGGAPGGGADGRSATPGSDESGGGDGDAGQGPTPPTPPMPEPPTPGGGAGLPGGPGSAGGGAGGGSGAEGGAAAVSEVPVVPV
jgi:type IV secretion system protein TrbL